MSWILVFTLPLFSRKPAGGGVGSRQGRSRTSWSDFDPSLAFSLKQFLVPVCSTSAELKLIILSASVVDLSWLPQVITLHRELIQILQITTRKTSSPARTHPPLYYLRFSRTKITPWFPLSFGNVRTASKPFVWAGLWSREP